jgi:hypothetical protein
MKNMYMGNDFGYYSLKSVTICQKLSVVETTFEHLEYFRDNAILDVFINRKPLEVVVSNDRSLTCTSTQDIAVCPCCQEPFTNRKVIADKA